MSRYTEMCRDEYESGLEAEQECKRCHENYDRRNERFRDGLCEHCQYVTNNPDDDEPDFERIVAQE